MSDTHFYTVTLPDERTVMHVEAKSKGEARRFALSGVEARRLSTREVLDLTARGIAIVSAQSGSVCNSPGTNTQAEPQQEGSGE